MRRLMFMKSTVCELSRCQRVQDFVGVAATLAPSLFTAQTQQAQLHRASVNLLARQGCSQRTPSFLSLCHVIGFVIAVILMPTYRLGAVLHSSR